jgi:hypothetical protein
VELVDQLQLIPEVEVGELLLLEEIQQMQQVELAEQDQM